MVTAKELKKKLSELQRKRLSGEIDPKTFYRELLQLAFSLKEAMFAEIDRLPPQELNKKIPIVLLFLEELIAEMERTEKVKTEA